MTALTDTFEAKRQDGHLIDYEVKAAQNIYKGAIVCVKHTTDGYLYAALSTQASDYLFAGIAAENSLVASVTTDTQGLRRARVFRNGVFELVTSGDLTQAVVGEKVYAEDDNTVGTTTTHALYVGIVVEYVSSTRVKVDIGPGVNEYTLTA